MVDFPASYVSLPECNCILGGFPYFSPPFFRWPRWVGRSSLPQFHSQMWKKLWACRDPQKKRKHESHESSDQFASQVSGMKWNLPWLKWNKSRNSNGVVSPPKTPTGLAPENAIPIWKGEIESTQATQIFRVPAVSFWGGCSCFIPSYTPEI